MPNAILEIEARAFFANIGRRRVDGDRFVGIAEARETDPAKRTSSNVPAHSNASFPSL
jgi:hypothetical protein